MTVEPLSKEERAELRRLCKANRDRGLYNKDAAFYAAAINALPRLMDALDATEEELNNLRSHHHKWLSWQCDMNRELDDLRQRLWESEGREALLRGALLAQETVNKHVEECEDCQHWDEGAGPCDEYHRLVERANKLRNAAFATPTPPLWDPLTRLLEAIGRVEERRDGEWDVVLELRDQLKGVMGR